MHRFAFVTFLLILMLISPPLTRADQPFTELGQIELQPHFSQEAFDLGKYPGRLKAIRLVVTGGSVRIKNVTLVQVDGKSLSETRIIELAADERTKPIRFDSVDGNGSKINIDYVIDDKTKPATLKILGSIDKARIGTDRSAEASKGHARSSARTRRRSAQSTDCVAQAKCTPVSVFFGTNRARSEGDSTAFDEKRSQTLSLGKAVVTVPRAFRKRGEIPRPAWSDLLSFQNPFAEDPSRHFIFVKQQLRIYQSEAEFIDAARAAAAQAGTSGDHAFIFVHGYNTTFENAVYRAAQISYDLGTDDHPFGIPLLFSWPSSGQTEDYVYDLDSSRMAAASLKAYITLVIEKLAPKHVHVIAHSMGNWPTLAVLNEMAQASATTRIDTVILAAPDVDQVEFASFVKNSTAISKSFTLYASSEDRALLASRKIRRNLFRAGDIMLTGPVLLDGLDTLDVSDLSMSVFSLNHSNYADQRELLNDMSVLMQSGQRPPGARNQRILPQGAPPQQYWKYVKAKN